MRQNFHTPTAKTNIEIILGSAMGFPLGPTLANFFLVHFELNIFQHDSPFHPKIYLHYVDNVFAVLDNDNSCSEFLTILNSQHKIHS